MPSLPMPSRAVAPWAALAVLAVALPTLIAFNVPPSATFFNQAAALIGWGGSCWLLIAAARTRGLSGGRGLHALHRCLRLLVVAACASPLWAARRGRSLVVAPACCCAAGPGVPRRACCDPLATGAPPSARSASACRRRASAAPDRLVQVFAPRWTDGDWIARSAAGPRGRQPAPAQPPQQPAAVGDRRRRSGSREARPAAARSTAPLAAAVVFVVVLSGVAHRRVGMLVLARWGLLDRRLSRTARRCWPAPLSSTRVLWAGPRLGRLPASMPSAADAVQRQGRHLELALRDLVEHAGADPRAPMVRRRLRRIQLRVDADAVPGPPGGLLRPHPQPAAAVGGRTRHSAGAAGAGAAAAGRSAARLAKAQRRAGRRARRRRSDRSAPPS